MNDALNATILACSLRERRHAPLRWCLAGYWEHVKLLSILFSPLLVTGFHIHSEDESVYSQLKHF